MNNEAMKEVLNELFSHLERLETQSEAILQFLREKKRVTDKQLAPYLEQAGNTSNVKWRATRVRINHLLEPEHPEKEIKLGKKPELHEDSSSAASSEEKRSTSADKEDKRVESVDEERKRTASGDQPQIESSDSKDQRAKSADQAEPTPVKAVQARPTDGNADKPEEKSDPTQVSKQASQQKDEQKPDSVHHPTEVTEPLAQQQRAEPAAQLNAKEKDREKDAA